jgi:DNA-binding GntR family transcriptional regulator
VGSPSTDSGAIGSGPPSGDENGAAPVLPSAERVHAALREEILTGLLRDGERLVETEVAARFHVSRTPVREALARLQAARLTIVEPAQGTIVRPVSVREIEETYVLREAFEGLAARLASDRATRWDIARLQGLQRHMQRYRDEQDWQAWSEANWMFHDTIFQAAGNRRLRMANGELVDLVRRFFRISAADSTTGERTLREHDAIVQALEAHDPDAAEGLARSHVVAAGAETIRQVRAERKGTSGPTVLPVQAGG